MSPVTVNGLAVAETTLPDPGVKTAGPYSICQFAAPPEIHDNSTVVAVEATRANAVGEGQAGASSSETSSTAMSEVNPNPRVPSNLMVIVLPAYALSETIASCQAAAEEVCCCPFRLNTETKPLPSSTSTSRSPIPPPNIWYQKRSSGLVNAEQSICGDSSSAMDPAADPLASV